ncbi:MULTISPECIES: nicotinate-nucleotide--dimethylbenzimidazole phosphoribosyltransferase [unclassified Mesorhizobium]|uniref:nicotinate-nucleotide--dimethylbenzimidazole phosphoribosyltransferase n=1 Tax=unclassified Mesorhizobium TaxID=325217 RepID=UPI0011270074|nr:MULTISPECIES: nicotinate-nucleotide--dimethylbenzimidazole phosphoribosyltransferase [unclassified Mesorhizobium]MBZ9913784.1 nicotinate-nucleotide--dimethylbenzimidazole phosphoribosyltransferase [Mesorhizobium sp. CA16]TPI84231.1 nicotinate-nucleotide--dimethylbenzimidazole phosphoribosyltransferase [Mesorhizobium sp. B2-8-9]
MSFKSLEDLRAACLDLPSGSDAAASAVARRQDTLTKPQGSLGRLEAIAAWLGRWQARDMPKLDHVKVVVFAGNHGVTAQGVSAYPSEVTVQMVANFAGGGAAINQLARVAGAKLDVIPLDLDHPTGDFTIAPAMDEKAFLAAVSAGYDTVTKDLDLVCFGEMGIGNTTPAAAISTALFGGGAEKWTGRGTGVDDAGLLRKVVAIEAGLKRHADALSDPLKIAAALGGRELAAILGATLAARKNNVPVLLDGFVCTAAAAPLARLHPTGLAHTIAAHVSAEAGHRRLLEALGLPPLLDLGMRLGEGSGACLAVNIVRSALECHAKMASFAEAGVSEK